MYRFQLVHTPPLLYFRGVTFGVVLTLMVGVAAATLAAQSAGRASLRARVLDAQGGGVESALVILQPLSSESILTRHTDHTGSLQFTALPAGQYVLIISKPGFRDEHREVTIADNGHHDLEVHLQIEGFLDSVTVVGRLPESGVDELNGRARMDDVSGTSLFAGKKSDVLVLSRLDANLASGNTRQVFGKIPGTNVWENDGSGLQIGVSNRGLDPNRSWEMNSRQNGYDITADIFGYPEAYFTPPLEAVERVEVVRGSSSLQYGPQFGGLVNYVLKKAPTDRRATFSTTQTGGGNGVFSSHNRVGGRVGQVTYNGYYNHRQADGWRENAGFENNTAFASVEYAATERLNVGLEFTGMHSLLQMAGGLTDEMFKADARQSVRSGNWFALTWLLPSLKVDYTINPSTRLTVQSYALRGTRYSLFNSQPVALPNGSPIPDDPAAPRTLYFDRFHNYGTELRLMRHYNWLGSVNSLAAGVRYYRGKTVRQHGVGLPGHEARFDLLVPEVDRNLHFRTDNVAGFVENAFRVTPKLTITPGMRLDHVESTGDGRPIVGVQERTRVIPLFGIGATQYISDRTSLYANITQAYRATLFNDMWRPDPGIVIDPNLSDMKGYVSELGWRGRQGEWLTFDVGGFYLKYGDRLGLVTRQDPANRTISLWTNVSDSRNVGIESFVESDVLRLIRDDGADASLFVFSSLSATSARYQDGALGGNRVESAPGVISRWGVTYRRAVVSATLQHSYVGDQFTDASNTVATADGVQGRIPAYQVWDATLNYRYRKDYSLRLGINNLADARYFTRRATSYPGPGLIPAEGRSVYLSIGWER
jgi:Fe(3+) dicitrate transport protein